MPIELVSVKSYLSSKKICSSGTTRRDFPELGISVCAHWCGIQERSVVLDILQYCIILNLYVSTPEPVSCDTGQRIPYFDSCQLITTWMCKLLGNLVPNAPLTKKP